MTLLIESATARLRLRQWQDREFPTSAQTNPDPIVMDWLGAPFARAGCDTKENKKRKYNRNRG